VLDLLRDADEIRIVSHAFNESSLRVVGERTANGDGTFEGVLSRSAVDALAADSALRRRLQRLLGSDGVEVRIFDGEIPLAVTVADDIVHLLVRDEDGVLRASVDTDDPAVREWAGDAFDRYWGQATPINPDEFGS
jgi:hypothetical protein